MIRVIPEAEAHALTVRGDVPGVLDGYAGPVIWGKRAERIALGRAHAGFALVVGDASDALSHWAPATELRLPLANPLVQAHLVEWLGRGERYSHVAACPGLHPETAHVPCPSGWSGCDGYRRPFNRYPWLTPEAHGGLPDWIRLALIAGSVERVAAGGMGPIVDVLDAPWRGDPKSGRRSLDYKNGDAYAIESPGPAWKTWRLRVTRERNTREILGRFGSRAEADAEALSLGVAITDETPAGRVIRFEVPNG